jgi:hypothetical protein
MPMCAEEDRSTAASVEAWLREVQAGDGEAPAVDVGVREPQEPPATELEIARALARRLERFDHVMRHWSKQKVGDYQIAVKVPSASRYRVSPGSERDEYALAMLRFARELARCSNRERQFRLMGPTKALRGRDKLVCTCPPKPCHGWVLAFWIREGRDPLGPWHGEPAIVGEALP